MKIIVCVKQVIDTAARINIKNGELDTQRSSRVLNPYDEYAVEEALKIREKMPESEVTVISVGAEGFRDTLKTGLAMGADRAIHLSDPVFEGLDNLGVAQVLAKAIRTLNYDLILCGRQAVDDDMAHVGPSLAVLLGLPFVTVITKLEIFPDLKSAVITRQIEGGSEILETPVPVLLTCQKGLNQPRLPSLKGIMAAKKKEIQVMDAAAIDFDPHVMGKEANRLQEDKLELPPSRKKGEILGGSVEESASRLVQALREDEKVV